jgi:hypothetical protein
MYASTNVTDDGSVTQLPEPVERRMRLTLSEMLGAAASLQGRPLIGRASGATIPRDRPPRFRVLHDMSISTGLTPDEVRARLHELRQHHRDLDSAIESLERAGNVDQLQVRRLKKQKLILKDQISAFEDLLIPDIIA